MGGARADVETSKGYRKPTLSVPDQTVTAVLNDLGVTKYSEEGIGVQAFGAWLIASQKAWMAENGRKFPRRDDHDGDRRDYRPRNSFGAR
jgi:hypothetical protein